MTILKMTDIPSRVIFECRQFALGNGRGPYCVYSELDQIVYLMGTYEDCIMYLHGTKQEPYNVD